MKEILFDIAFSSFFLYVMYVGTKYTIEDIINDLRNKVINEEIQIGKDCK